MSVERGEISKQDDSQTAEITGSDGTRYIGKIDKIVTTDGTVYTNNGEREVIDGQLQYVFKNKNKMDTEVFVCKSISMDSFDESKVSKRVKVAGSNYYKTESKNKEDGIPYHVAYITTTEGHGKIADVKIIWVESEDKEIYDPKTGRTEYKALKIISEDISLLDGVEEVYPFAAEEISKIIARTLYVSADNMYPDGHDGMFSCENLSILLISENDEINKASLTNRKGRTEEIRITVDSKSAGMYTGDTEDDPAEDLIPIHIIVSLKGEPSICTGHISLDESMDVSVQEKPGLIPYKAFHLIDYSMDASPSTLEYLPDIESEISVLAEEDALYVLESSVDVNGEFDYTCFYTYDSGRQAMVFAAINDMYMAKKLLNICTTVKSES